MNICILDDCKFIIEAIEKMIALSCNKLKISEPKIFSFTDPEDFIDFITSSDLIDVCFLDIYLENKIDGLEVAKLVKDINYHTLIVFTTSYDNYFPEMVQVEPFRFLAKPLEYDDFYKVFEAVYNRTILKKEEDKRLVYMCKINGINFSINLNDVVYFSSYKRKIHIHGIKTFNIDFYEKLDNVEEEIRLITNKFVRINKSYLFNREHIDLIGKNFIIVEGIKYTISPKYKNNIKIIT